MKVYLEQDTALIKVTITQNDIPHSPATSCKITVWAPDSDGDAAHASKLIDAASMTENSTGSYTYYYPTSSLSAGVYSVMVVATESTSVPITITREDGEFQLKTYPG
jgi:hypothetical protein